MSGRVLVREALTFDDVLILPGYSEVLPHEAALDTTLGRDIKLKLPLLSAAMDTVTECKMAIALANAGGMGFVHKNMSVEMQSAEVRLVKEAKPAGKHASLDKQGRLLVGAAVGCGEAELERADALVAAGCDVIVVDSSHGHSEGVLRALRRVRERHPSVVLVGGNVCTYEGALALADAGADCVKVGVGPGSICTTRIVTGCGCPQFSAILDVARITIDRQIPIIADGGVRYSGDIAKALAAGASAVMLGSLFAACEEAPGETKLFNNTLLKVYRGMGSASAMQQGSADRYFQSSARKFVPEGVEGYLPFRGSVVDTIYQMTGGLRSCMGLIGAPTIQHMWQASFVKVTSLSLNESHPHSLAHYKNAPNYAPPSR